MLTLAALPADRWPRKGKAAKACVLLYLFFSLKVGADHLSTGRKPARWLGVTGIKNAIRLAWGSDA